MTRDLSEAERANLYAGHCPNCGGAALIPGPRGAASQNFECADCGAAFNRLSPDAVARWGLDQGGKVPPFGEQIRPPRIVS